MCEVITSINSAVIIRIITVITVIIVANPGLLHCPRLASAGCAAEVYNGLRDLLDVLRDLLVLPRLVMHNNGRRGQPLGRGGQVGGANVQPLLRSPAQIESAGRQVVLGTGRGWQGGGLAPEPLAGHEARLSVQGGGCARLRALSPPASRGGHGGRPPGGRHGWKCGRGREVPEIWSRGCSGDIGGLVPRGDIELVHTRLYPLLIWIQVSQLIVRNLKRVIVFIRKTFASIAYPSFIILSVVHR